MAESFELQVSFPVEPSVLYGAWLDSDQHAAMTGGEAECSNQVGGEFSSWDGYFEGMNVALEPQRRIVQCLRTPEFPEDAPDSRVELVFEPEATGTRLILRHSDIPEGHAENYRRNWEQFYFAPMRVYFDAP